MPDDNRYPPLMTSRSPSIERARREWQHPAPVGPAQLPALFALLSEAEANAARACGDVAKTLEAAAVQAHVGREGALHEARRQALAALVEAHGGSPPRPDECREILAGGLDAVAHATTDRDAMTALERVRSELAAVYAETLRSEFLDEAQRAEVEQIRTSGNATV